MLQRSKTRPLLPQRRAANAVSVRIKEAADTAEIGCCSVCSCMQTNKGRAAEELAKTAAATAQRRAAEEPAKTAAAQQDADDAASANDKECGVLL